MWLAFHVYYHSSQDELILDGIRPLVLGSLCSERIQGYFFVRYFDGGPHVRLRLKLAPSADPAAVRRAALDALHRYVDAHPSRDTIPIAALERHNLVIQRLERRPDATPVQPNNSVVDAVYEPEYRRYGGEKGVETAEWHFQHSSDTAMNLLEKVRTAGGASRATRYEGVVEFLVSLLLTSGCTVSQARDLYSRHCAFLARIYPTVHQHRWERQFEVHAPLLRAWVTSAVQQLRGPDGAALERIAHGRELRSRLAAIAASCPESSSALWSRQLLSYAHMFCNRASLGIAEEAYVTYAVSRVLGEGALS